MSIVQAALPDSQSSVILPKIDAPKSGGAVHQVIEKFAANAVTGAGQFALPLPISPGRQDFHPNLRLSYSSGAGNGSFGLGWQLSLSSIKRKTQKQLPKYGLGDDDVFVWSDVSDLVPVTTETREEHRVTTYQPRVEGSFALIERYVHSESGHSFWKVQTADNITHIYGRSPLCCIHHPENENQVFEWLIEESRDALGNIIRYTYRPEDFANTPDSLFEELRNEQTCTNRYLHQVLYGNKVPHAPQDWLFKLAFSYSKAETADTSLTSPRDWDCRQDIFSHHRAGFDIRNYRLCHQVQMYHQFEELGTEPVLVRSLDLQYEESPLTSQLRKAEVVGYQPTPQGLRTSTSPATTFEYTRAQPDQEVQRVQMDALSNWPGGLANARHLWVDLNGEGLAGILTETDSAWYYRSNLGNGRLGPMTTLPSQPNLSAGATLLSDLDQDGFKEFIISEEGLNGFYTRNDDGWESFVPFSSPMSNDPLSPKAFLDLNGNGLADALVDSGDEFLIHYSKGKAGYEKAMSVKKGMHEPLQINQPGIERVLFADMTGDGLQDLVKVSPTQIAYWPALGYGRFGEKVTMANAPFIDNEENFDPQALRLTDIDGSGPADLLYLRPDHAKYWTNQSGNAWSAPQVIDQLPPRDSYSSLDVIDLLGDGTACLVWSSGLPGRENEINYVRLTGGIKPHLLSTVDNGGGMRSHITYKPSTAYYLDSQLEGKPWVTKIPFPVQVVDRLSLTDQISQSVLHTQFKYSHGFYDGVEKEFKGFGLVEQWDSEFFEQYKSDLSDAHFAHPIHTKRWYHTGAYTQHNLLTEQFRKEYYSGDEAAQSLPDPKVSFEASDFESNRQAHRALAGSLLREEVYAQDHQPESDIPYKVMETAYEIRMLQAPEANKDGIYQVLSRESLSHHYERGHPNDPRITHEFLLQADAYGNPSLSASVAYPRRANPELDVIDEQRELHTLVEQSTYINYEGDFRRLGVIAENKTFRVSQLAPANRYFDFEELKSLVEDAMQSPVLFGGEVNGTRALLASWQQWQYWDEANTSALPQGEVGATGLLYSSREAVYPEGHVQQLFGDHVNVEDIAALSLEEAESHLWRRNPAVFYADDSQFHLPIQEVNALGYGTSVVYDQYGLFPIQTTDALGNESRTEFDYHFLLPHKTTDPNGNASEFAYDPLGSLEASTAYGTEGDQLKGDLPMVEYVLNEHISVAEVFSDPHRFLQGASSFSFTDTHAWAERGEPLQSVTLTRRTHERALEGDESTEIEIAVSYVDGFGRSLQSKVKVEPGEAFLRDPEGQLITDEEGGLVEAQVDERWLVSGRTVFDNKARPIRQYEPFYSSISGFETEEELAEYGVSPLLHYDPLGRVYKTDLPDGFFTEVEFSAWEVKTQDQNDTIVRSEVYQQNLDEETRQLGAVQWQAMEEAANHQNTPTVALLDSLGRTVRTTVYQEAGEPLTSIDTYDPFGNLYQQTDARQAQLNALRSPGERLANFTYHYDMQGMLMKTESLDAGEQYQLQNVLAQETISINSRGFRLDTSYDALLRPTALFVTKDDAKKQVQKLEYGEGEPNAGALNLRGQLVRHYDESGLMEVKSIDFKGNVTSHTRQLRKDYKNEADWTNTSDDLLEAESFEFSVQLDALNRRLLNLSPDGSQTRYTYVAAGRLNQLTHRNADHDYELIRDIRYNARAQRTRIDYGNGIRKSYAYNPLNFRLSQLHSYRIGIGNSVQDIAYTYDPVGNISQITDRSHETLFHANQQVSAAHHYTYDALYQLKSATGRCHTGINAGSYQNGMKQSAFLAMRPNAPTSDGQQLGNYMRSFNYDAAGNLTRVKHLGPNAFTRDYTISRQSNHAIEREQQGIDPETHFDAAGNMTQLSHLRDITWNYRNNIASISLIERDGQVSDKEYYVYDASGKRSRKVTEFLEEGGNRIRIEEKIYLGATEIMRTRYEQNVVKEQLCHHIADGEMRIATIYRNRIGHADEPNEFIRYELGNHLGSAALTLDEAGRQVTYEEYFPYGGSAFVAGVNEAEVSRKVYRYSGKERDDYSGLYYYGFRYYAPWLGRWLSADPAGTVDGLNLYQFVRGNPVKLIDPKGLEGRGPKDYYPDIKDKDDLIEKHLDDSEEEPEFALFVSLQTNANDETLLEDLRVHIPDSKIKGSDKKKVLILRGEQITDMKQAVELIKEAVGDKKISRLTISGHGSPGVISGFLRSPTILNGSNGTERNRERLKDLEGLRDVLADDAYVFLDSCNTGRESVFVHEIAKALDARVMAPLKDQHSETPGLDDNAILVFPNGEIINKELSDFGRFINEWHWSAVWISNHQSLKTTSPTEIYHMIMAPIDVMTFEDE